VSRAFPTVSLWFSQQSPPCSHPISSHNYDICILPILLVKHHIKSPTHHITESQFRMTSAGLEPPPQDRSRRKSPSHLVYILPTANFPLCMSPKQAKLPKLVCPFETRFLSQKIRTPDASPQAASLGERSE
jgi:hypothetical protein